MRLAIAFLLAAGCSKESPKPNPSVDPTPAPSVAPTGPTRTAKLPDLPKPRTQERPTNLPAEANPPGVPVITGELKVDRDVRYIDEAVGVGDAPVSGQPVTVHYSGWLTDGTPFDSSRERDEPIKFKFDGGQVIKGWDIGLSSMRVGGKRRIIIPAELAYGDRGAGGAIPPGAMLVFDVELVGVGN